MTIRQAKTKSGKRVNLDEMTKIDGGWLGWIMHGKGYAVRVFIPTGE